MFLKFSDLSVSLVCHRTEVEYLQRLREVLRTDHLFDRDMVDLYLCCLLRRFNSFYFLPVVRT